VNRLLPVACGPVFEPAAWVTIKIHVLELVAVALVILLCLLVMVWRRI
jgi:hypothetical protein